MTERDYEPMARMTDTELDSLIRSAMDSGITHGLIPPETADLMRMRLASLIDPAVITDQMADAFIQAESVEEAKQRLIRMMEDSGSKRLDVALMALNNALTEMEQASAAMSHACYEARASLAHAEEREKDFIAILSAI